MSIRVTHVLDQDSPEDSIRLLSLLLRKLPAGEVTQRVLVVGQTPSTLSLGPVLADQVPGRFDGPLYAALDLRRALSTQAPDVVLAWNGVAAAALTTAWKPNRSRSPVVATICDPADAFNASRWWRSTAGQGGIEMICPSRFMQRRLVECGVPINATAVIRPGVDFSAIRQARETIRREELGLPASGRVLLTASPPSRAGGQFLVIWAACMLHQIWPDARVVIPGISREQRRLTRLIEHSYCPEVFITTGDRYTPAELLAVSDFLVVPACEDVPTGWLAWAMAASVPIVAAAVPSVAELIADRHNGFLCKSPMPHTLAIRLRTAAESADVLRQCVDTARGQAYDVFRAQRCVDEYLKVLHNVHAGAPALANVLDAAIET